MKKLTVLLSTLVFTCTPSWCKSSKLVLAEQYICTLRVLGSADMLLNEIYARVMKFKGKEGQEGMWAREVKSNQMDWIKKRNKIEDEDEVLASYMGRIDKLYAILKDKQTRAVSLVYGNIKDVYTAVVNLTPQRLNLHFFSKVEHIN
ncbi:MAG: lysozyme inhibitor LprI family protein [Epsilonproteobacteria bacterium]|nr:lysozyme inhibitor LprI family protein [Campylobacterota bacterium]